MKSSSIIFLRKAGVPITDPYQHQLDIHSPFLGIREERGGGQKSSGLQKNILISWTDCTTLLKRGVSFEIKKGHIYWCDLFVQIKWIQLSFCIRPYPLKFIKFTKEGCLF